MKYKDNLLEKTDIEAQESNTPLVKLTSRVRESCAVLEAFDPSCSNNEKKRAGARAPTPVLSQTAVPEKRVTNLQLEMDST